MAFQQSDWIEVKKIAGKGRGVFARRDIPEGTVVERVPMLIVPIVEIDDTFLADYCFEWGKGTYGLALGYGSLYNHSYQPNAQYLDVGQQSKAYSAIRDIREGEEITINYNADPDNKTDVGFPVLE
ncbi:MAG: SET domain-containing protein [Planctomycetota bacterium]|nr:SET domain-containing protein [Planctomycetota bacterium]